MLAEFGKTRGKGQSKWLKDAFEYIKSRTGIKAAIFWNNCNSYEDDHTLTDKSFELYKEIMKDSYFIGAG